MRAIYTILTFLVFLSPLSVQAQTPLETDAKQAIVIDYETGAVLLEKNADEQMPTSSMSKVMTMYLVFEALKEGHVKLDDTFLVSEKAWKKQGSKMFVGVNDRVKVEDLIRGVIIQSGNDATIVLAEGLAGSEDAFAQLLNKKAEALGMDNSHFVNASGWPDPDHYSTARDLATMARSLVAEFPEYYKYYGEKEFTYNDIKQGNRNPLLYRSIGADGIKTGHTEAAGYGVIGSGVRNGRRVIVVVNGLDSVKARASESAKLLEWGLQFFENKNVIEAGKVVGEAPVTFGKAYTVPVVAKEDLMLTVPKMGSDEIEIELNLAGELTAPVKKGQQIGTIKITVPGYYELERPAIAAQDVEKLGIFWRLIENVRMMVTGK